MPEYSVSVNRDFCLPQPVYSSRRAPDGCGSGEFGGGETAAAGAAAAACRCGRTGKETGGAQPGAQGSMVTVADVQAITVPNQPDS